MDAFIQACASEPGAREAAQTRTHITAVYPIDDYKCGAITDDESVLERMSSCPGFYKWSNQDGLHLAEFAPLSTVMPL